MLTIFVLVCVLFFVLNLYRLRTLWTTEKDLLLCREVLVTEPYKAKERTVQRAQMWHNVADNLNELENQSFKVDKRSIREHLAILLEKFRKKMRM